ncbi:hypothetical protein K458DRAFT_405096 [Lentithecium fluviatile CBS 122367]|uniref:RING-type domain-containing protein n=1 Tax=Lentithecium fluviatile CBS 122367 TaxID=1168545 RepID=A0A6G1IY81_9PLEO|nr:hypothetical protein K458DRAFT_405096 [Lentithecium fluviatile CBS 122367]
MPHLVRTPLSPKLSFSPETQTTQPPPPPPKDAKYHAQCRPQPHNHNSSSKIQRDTSRTHSSIAAMANAQSPAATVAATFIETKTDIMSPHDVPIMDECPICLESYNNEAPTRITGADGCNHIIGLKCLTSLLSANPNQETKCPICRTVWIHAPPRQRDPAVRRWAMMTQMGPDAANPRGPRAPGRRMSLQVISIDSDSEESVTEESYMQYRQEIADIRSRARNNQLSRRQRREEGAARERERERNGGGNGGGNGRSNPAQRIDNSGVPARGLTIRDPFATVLRQRYDTSRPANPGLRNNDYDISMIAASRGPSPFRLSSSPEIIDGDQARLLRERTRRLEHKEEELRNREHKLNDRERQLGDKERDLHRREQQLFVREQRVARREREKDEYLEMKQRHLGEIRAVAQRQQDELVDAVDGYLS